MSRLDRLQARFLKPAPETGDTGPAPSADELESSERRADDKERMIGLVAAPLGALIAILVVGSLVDHDPSAPSRHVSVGFYEGDLAVLVALSVAMMATALLRKRMLLGIVLALYGLDLFNLHQWGFAVPFVLAGSWYLVRAYRIHQGLLEATGKGRRARKAPEPSIRRSKRYTPPKR